ncbi:uncharacterized protein BX664DRAFT_49842 [Halteromyces radiatus]|uniref:uncharacterized protein n=1 Tax=Halteromyces radiatus TaxID=101107 RepID=UPI002220F600|nr:uncharacterized protein BX664DRAFT_49842 [Halteromyces radiatus]KAI8076301.1 hypothetical protein BX664DRAFT_49842 [Halteromyces radiatus]
MTIPKCHPKDINFKINGDIDVPISRFFREVPARDWCFPNYCEWHRNTSSTLKVNRLNLNYRSSLAIIKEDKRIPPTIKSFVGYLLATQGKHELDNTPTNIYQNSLVGCHVDTFNQTNYQTQTNDAQSPRSLEDGIIKDIPNVISDGYDDLAPEAEPCQHVDGPPNSDEDDADNDFVDGILPCEKESAVAHVESELLRPLYGYVYSLFKGEEPDLQHLKLIDETSLQAKIYNHCVTVMKDFKKLDRCGKSFLSVFLSGMINTISVQHRPCVMSCLSRNVLKSILDTYPKDAFILYQNRDVESIVLNLKVIYMNEGITGVRKLILKKKLDAYGAGVDVKGSTTMVVLDIIDHVLNMVEYSTWKNGQSEAEYFDYWKPIFKILFRDTPAVELKTGETACTATKYDRQVNELEHGNIRKSVGGRKIDMLVCSVDDDDLFELTSAEFKPMGVSEITETIQLNKNLRINKSILSRLVKHIGDPNVGVIGMDIIGKLLTFLPLFSFRK